MRIIVAVSFAAFVGALPDESINVSISEVPEIDVGLIHHRDDGKGVSTKQPTDGDADERTLHAEQAVEKAIATVRGEAKAGGKFLGRSRSRRNSSDEGDPDAAMDLSTAESMEAAMTELMMGKSAMSGTPMGGSIKMIGNLITNTMMPKVKAAHEGDQKLLRKLSREMKKCGSTKNTAFQGAKGKFNKYKKMSRLHKRCRADEAVRYSSKENCKRDQDNRFQIKVLKCKAFAEVSRTLGTTKNNKAIVSKGGSESVESYIRRMSSTFCGKHVHGPRGKNVKPGGWGGGLEDGFLDKYLHAKEDCHRATRAWVDKVKECKKKNHAYNVRKAQCNQYQTHMDGASCARAVLVKDACEAYAGCYYSRRKTFKITEAKIRFNERDRKAEWRGLKRMECLVTSFADGQVKGKEVDSCKKKKHSTEFFKVKYPEVPTLIKCAIPTLYPSTGAYKRAEFAPLPFLAKGKQSQECQGVVEIGTTPGKGSPKSCSCRRVTLNGHYTPGPLVKCTRCLDIRRSQDVSSCPRGTKLFAPTSRADWKTFVSSATPLRDPNFVIDVTRPQNGCGGCTSNPMNSGNSRQQSWRTSDGSPWWLRSTPYKEPSGDYAANCFMDLRSKPRSSNLITFDDNKCNYHSRSYYCQPAKVQLKPRSGSPVSCKCTKVDLAGSYSPGGLIKCEQCITVYKSTQKNSCPEGMKIFSPRSRADWKTFLKSAEPLRAPNWIIDITRPQTGCGGCKRYAMNSKKPQQATWRTSDGSPWWLRSTLFKEPSGDYSANCFMDLYKAPANENTIYFNDEKCHYRSRSYYCQPLQKKQKAPKARTESSQRRLVAWSALKPGITEKVFYFKQGSACPDLSSRNPNMIRRVRKIKYTKTKNKWSGFAKSDHFAVRWDAFLIIEKAGVYTFYLSSDDGSKLYIDKKKVVDNDGLHGMRTAYGKVKLVRGQHYLFATMFEKGGDAGMKLIYKGPDTGKKARFVGYGGSARYVPPKGFKEEVYYLKGMKKVPNLDRLAAMERIRPHVVYEETSKRWPGFKRADDFAVRWTGLLKITQGGQYRWSIMSDDGSKLYLRKDSGKWISVVNNDGLHSLKNKESNYRVSGSVQVKLEYFEHAGKACMIFRYMGPDTKNRMKFVPQKVMLASI
jgi:hypothetical protein